MYILLLHTEYLRKICDEKESSLQGLKYIGGPRCPECEWREVIPYVSYPDEQQTPSDEAECEECGHICNVNLLLTSQVIDCVPSSCLLVVICFSLYTAMQFEIQQSTNKCKTESTQPSGMFSTF